MPTVSKQVANKSKKKAVGSVSKQRPFEIRVEVAKSFQLFEAFDYPSSYALIGRAVEQHLCFDFREYSFRFATGKERANAYLIEVGSESFQLSFKMRLGDTKIEPGSTKITSSLILVIAVSAYNGIATYPDFKDGLHELFEDLSHIASEYYQELHVPVRDGPEEYQPQVELFFRDEREIFEETVCKIRRAKKDRS